VRTEESFPFLNVCTDNWKVMQVPEGEMGFQELGMVHSFSSPLAEGGITIYYLSSCDSDFILVPEKDLGNALCNLRKRFEVKLDNEELEGGFSNMNVTEGTKDQKERGKEGKRRKLKVLKDHFYLCKLKNEFIDLLSGVVVNMILFQNQTFFSYFETGEGTSGIVVDANRLDHFPKEMIDVVGDQWIPIRVDDGPLGFVEVGIVNSISEPLSRAKITAQIYFSTYYTDYTMVREKEIETAVNCLKELFDVSFK